MTRIAFAIACCCVAAATAALETPLTVAQGDRMVLIDAAYGSIATYQVTAGVSLRMGLDPRRFSANFIADLELYARRPLATQANGVVITALRNGINTKPQYGEMFMKGSFFSERQTAADIAAGQPAHQLRALRAEDAFWKAPPAYDGIIRVALSGDGKYLAIAVQATHTLMLYSLENDTANLVAVHNWGPEIQIQVGWHTSPSPLELINLVPADKQKDFQHLVGLDVQAPAASSTPPPVLQTEEAPTPKSEIWIGAAPSNGFLLVDTLNQCTMLYQYSGKNLELRSVRNLRIDLLATSYMQEPNTGAYNSRPAGGEMLNALLSSCKSQLLKLKLPTEKEEILMLLSQRAPKGHTNTFEALFQPNETGIAMLNFADRHVFLTIDTQGSQTINLASVRDYSLDTAVALLIQEITDRQNAVQEAAKAKGYSGNREPQAALMSARLALSLDPRLGKELEKNLKGAFRDPALQTEFQTLLDDAARKADELDKQDEARKKTMDELKHKAPAK